MGLPVTWRLAAGPGGAFAERLAGEDLAFGWGHPGRPGAPCWEVDAAGVAKSLELDDHESLLLAAWVRTGWWLAPGAAEALCLSLEAGGGGGSAGQAARRKASASAASASAPPVVGVRLAGGALVARVTLDPSTWLPASMAQPLCGAAEVWSYEGWAPWAGGGGLLYPGTTTHAASAGGDNRFVTRRGEVVVRAGAEVKAPRRGRKGAATPAAAAAVPSTATTAAAWAGEFVPPPTDVLRPPGSAFDADAPRDVPAWWTPSGHLLVRPRLSAPLPPDAPPGTLPPPPTDAGLFLVDTGASGLVLDAAAADALGLPAFGELHVSGMAGPVRARLRRGGALRLGPLTLSRPLFMEMSVAGLVRGAPGPVVGIIGYDVFRAAVVTLPRPAGPSGARAGRGAARAAPSSSSPPPGAPRLPKGTTATTVRLDDPVTYAPPKAATGRWQPLVMDANLPHVRAPFAPGRGGVGGGGGGAGAALSAADAAAAAPLLAPHPVLGEATNLPLSASGGGRAPAAVAAAGALAPCPRADPPPPDPPGLASRAALFMIDSGAGGVDVMFHRRAAAALGLLPEARGQGEGGGGGGPPPPPPRVVRGLGGGAASAGAAAGPAPSASAPTTPPPPPPSSSSASAVGVTPGDLAWLALGGRPYTPVRALVAGAGGLDLSLYTAGVICADLLARATVIVDYPRRRAAFLPPPGRPPSLGAVTVRGGGGEEGAPKRAPRPRSRRARALRGADVPPAA